MIISILVVISVIVFYFIRRKRKGNKQMHKITTKNIRGDVRKLETDDENSREFIFFE